MRPNSSFLQVLPSMPIFGRLASTGPDYVYLLCVSPTLSVFLPATSTTQLPPGARLPFLLW